MSFSIFVHLCLFKSTAKRFRQKDEEFLSFDNVFYGIFGCSSVFFCLSPPVSPTPTYLKEEKGTTGRSTKVAFGHQAVY